ncbi:unnamed protein product [Caenorhabditis nigoni]
MFSVVLLFENRCHSLIAHRLSDHRWKRILFHLVNGIIAVFYMIPVCLNIPEQKVAKLDVLTVSFAYFRSQSN